MKQCRTLLDYCATYPNVFLRYNASDMILNIDSDAAYLVAPKARSRIAGYFQLNSNFRSPPTTNGAILLECKTLRHVVASSAEAETAGLFHNAQVAIPIRYILTEMGLLNRPLQSKLTMSRPMLSSMPTSPKGNQSHGHAILLASREGSTRNP